MNTRYTTTFTRGSRTETKSDTTLGITIVQAFKTFVVLSTMIILTSITFKIGMCMALAFGTGWIASKYFNNKE